MKQRNYQPQHLNKEKKRRYFPTTTLLVYLLIAVTLTTGVSFSRYTSTASGSANARVAKFEISTHAADGQRISLADGPDTASGSYVFTVSSASEVSVTYDVLVTLPSALPAGVTMTLDDKTATVSDDGLTYTFPGAGSFAPNPTGANTHTLTMTASDFSSATGLVGITVKIVASQMD